MSYTDSVAKNKDGGAALQTLQEKAAVSYCLTTIWNGRLTAIMTTTWRNWQISSYIQCPASVCCSFMYMGTAMSLRWTGAGKWSKISSPKFMNFSMTRGTLMLNGAWKDSILLAFQAGRLSDGRLYREKRLPVGPFDASFRKYAGRYSHNRIWRDWSCAAVFISAYRAEDK